VAKEETGSVTMEKKGRWEKTPAQLSAKEKERGRRCAPGPAVGLGELACEGAEVNGVWATRGGGRANPRLGSRVASLFLFLFPFFLKPFEKRF